MNLKSYVFGAFGALALVAGSCGFAHAAPPSPPSSVNWVLTGTLADGGKLLGSFTQDIYDFLSGSFNFSTTSTTFGSRAFNNGNVGSIDTGSQSLQLGNNQGFSLSFVFSHDLLTPSANRFTGFEIANNTRVTFSGTAVAVPSPIAGAGIPTVFAMAALLWLTRRSLARQG